MTSTSTEEYCRQKAAAIGTNFYYSTLYYSPDIKRSLYALHAFNAEIEQVIEECTDPGVARLKLSWWYEEIQRLFDNNARHPVTKELREAITRYPIINSELASVIKHHEQRINPAVIDTYEELLDDMRQGPGKIWRLSAHICGFRDNGTADVVNLMGSQIGIFYLMQFSRIYRQQRRDQLAEFINRLIVDMENSCRKLPEVDYRSQISVLIMARIIIQTCHEIARDGYLLREHRISLPPLRKLWIAWRTWRRYR